MVWNLAKQRDNDDSNDRCSRCLSWTPYSVLINFFVQLWAIWSNLRRSNHQPSLIGYQSHASVSQIHTGCSQTVIWWDSKEERVYCLRRRRFFKQLGGQCGLGMTRNSEQLLSLRWTTPRSDLNNAVSPPTKPHPIGDKEASAPSKDSWT